MSRRPMPEMTPKAIEDRRLEVIRLSGRGLPIAEIADRVGLTSEAVVVIRRKAGISKQYQSARSPFTGEQIRRAQELLADGCNFAEVARTVNASYHQIFHRFPGQGWTNRQCHEHLAVLRKYDPNNHSQDVIHAVNQKGAPNA